MVPTASKTEATKLTTNTVKKAKRLETSPEKRKIIDFLTCADTSQLNLTSSKMCDL